MQIDNFEVKSYPAIDTMGTSSGSHPLRVCIVTEEIIGPVRNGGIASTYYHLSKGLAANGHDVHVLFLKGPIVQDETPEHWVRHFAEFGVTLHYLQFANRPCWGASVEWQDRFAAAYQWLRDQDPFDVIHTSEWRGGTLYALMAKRLGLAFQETLFLVKTSSPHIWNRHYQMQPIERRELVLAAYAEQKCVELADVVIGGSAHLITFMDQIGYKLPAANVFVQPNIVDFSKVIVTDLRPPRKPGDLVRSRELIFFGRLEGRKGIEMFCNAMDILTERGVLPEKVSFMGKWGAPLATQSGMKVEEYLETKSAAWSFPVTIITDKNQPEALSHMCSRDMIAVMPSLIENSTMAVYEALENNIPFIATGVGGTPELIDPADHAFSLVEPKATALADQLERVLRDGQVIARSSFSNAHNLEVWYGFHAYIGELIKNRGRRGAIEMLTAGVDHPGDPVSSISHVVLVRRGDDLNMLVKAVLTDPPDQVVFGVNDAAMRSQVLAAVTQLEAAGVDASVVECIGYSAGDALNRIVQAQTCDAMVVGHGVDVIPLEGFYSAARMGLTHRPDCLFTTFFQSDGNVMGMPVGGDVASQFLSARAYGPEFFAMRRQTYDRNGPFEPYDVTAGILHEYVTRVVENGPDDLLVYPEELLKWPDAQGKGQALAADSVYSYLKAKPLIDRGTLSERKIMLAALHQASGGGGAMGENVLRDGGRDEETDLWLMPVDWDRDEISQAMKRALVVGLDEAEGELLLYARGPGERRLSVRDHSVDIDLVQAIGDPGRENYVTLHRFVLPETWEAGSSFPLSWAIYQDEQKVRNQFLRINKIGVRTLALTARNTILSKAAMQSILNRQLEAFLVESALESSPISQSVLRAEIMGLRDQQTSIDAILAMTGQDDRSTSDLLQDGNDAEQTDKGHSDNPQNTTKALNVGTNIDDLLELAQMTGRGLIERKSLTQRSIALMQQLAASEPSTQGDIRSHLAPCGDNEIWAENGWLTGWAWDRADRDRILHVAVMQNDRPIFVVTADIHVPALGRRTPGLERHGFRIPILGVFLTPGRGDLSLLIWENRAVIRNGTLRAIEGDQPTLEVIL